MTLTLQPIHGIPLVRPSDELGPIIAQAIRESGERILTGDVLVLAQKIVSKAEGRLVNLSEVAPSARALELAEVTQKDARMIELVLQESEEVLRVRPGVIIVQHKNGFVCANAGIDHSNVRGEWGDPEDWVLLLPKNADESARRLREGLKVHAGIDIGVMIIDSHGRAWRMGTIGMAIGIAGVPGIVDLRGKPDLFGYHLRVTMVAAADELAAAASLVMGQANEKTPAVLVRGFPYDLRESSMAELIRPREFDLFR